MERRALATAACLALMAACTSRPATEMRLLAVSPPQGTVADPLEVEITGHGLQPSLETDFQKGGNSTLDAQFKARLVKSGGGATIELTQVTFTPRRTLTATIPAGLEKGLYDLVVVDPSGRAAQLTDAFRVVTPAEAVTGFRIDLTGVQGEGIPFLVTVTAVDVTGQIADGFAGTVTLSDLTGTVTPSTLGPFTLGTYQGQVVVRQVVTGDQLTVSDQPAADQPPRTGTSDPFDIRPGPVVRVAFASGPAAAGNGASACSPEIPLEARDALGTASPAANAIAIQLQGATDSPLAFFGDAGCTSQVTTVTIPAGATGTSFHFRGGAPPSLILRILPDQLPSAEQTWTIN